jgi:large subunit ribosomal protein L6
MSRIAKAPVTIPSGVEVKLVANQITVKGKLGELHQNTNPAVTAEIKDNQMVFAPTSADYADGWAQAGTLRQLVNNMVVGVTEGFSKKLVLVGVGYRAAAQGKSLNLTLGFSHPIVHELPEGITAETPSPTEIIIKGANKQLVGDVAAAVRGYRPPEPYKGKGVKYDNERIIRKEAKKK